MKFTTLALGALTLMSMSSFAEMTRGNTGRFCTGDKNELLLPVDNAYVERVVIEAEGVRHDGFIEAYADGVRVARLGVPGYDPLYTFRVRRHVSNIKLDFKAEGSSRRCFNIISFTAYGPAGGVPTNYDRYESDKVRNGSWGGEVLAIINSLNGSMYDDNLRIDPLFENVLKPLRDVSMYEGAAEIARDEKSLIKIERALRMAKIITDNQDILMDRLASGTQDYLMMDLLTIKEDILEHIDVKEKDIDESLEYVLSELDR